MDIAKQARDALRPTNTIESRDAPQPLHGASLDEAPHGQPSLSATPTNASKPGNRPAYLSESEAIAKLYYVEASNGERRYFEDYKRSKLAMRATDKSVSSKREDLTTIRAMLEIAQTRGWQAINITGSAAFKREAWIEASARGLEGHGFKPSDVDRQEADRRRAERGRSNEVRQPSSSSSSSLPSSTTTAAEQQTSVRSPDAPSTNVNMEGGGNPSGNRKALREAVKELSADGRLVLGALSEKIDRQMNQQGVHTKAEMKAFVASELTKKERAEGPIVLSAAQKRMATLAEPVRPAPTPGTGAAPSRKTEPDAPRRTLSR